GMGYVGSFNRVGSSVQKSPALVFSGKLRGATADTLAWAVSHEVGHNIGLDHVWSARYPDAQVAQGADVSPLHFRVMDYGSRRPASFWSEGERARVTTYGLSLRPDEPGTDATSARVLSDGAATGFITSGSDEDWYRLDDCADLVARVTTTSLTPNLDVSVRLVDENGVVVTEDAPPPTTETPVRNNGVDAAVRHEVDGTAPHYRVVRSRDSGGTTPSYPASHAVGGYTVDVAGCGTAGTVPSAPLAVKAVTMA